jgi:hypothetical protein
MENFNIALVLAQKLLSQAQAQAQAYQAKPSKAESKRMRDTLNDLKKVATDAKKELIALDEGNQTWKTLD